MELTDNEKKMMEELVKTVKDTITSHTKGMITEDVMISKINATLADAKKVSDDQIKELQTSIEVIGLELKAAKESAKAENLSIGEQYKKIIAEKKEAWDRFKSGRDANFEMEFKTAGTWLESTHVVGGNGYLPQPQFLPGITPIVANAPDIIPLCNVASCTSPMLIWVEKKNPDGTVVVTAEGDVKPLLDFDFDPNTSTAKKYPGKIKVSLEAIEDIPFMESEINTELRRAVNLAADTAVMAYIAANASAYSLATVLTTTPNNVDTIRAAIAQIKSVNHNATVCVMNPIDAANMDLEKATTGEYVLPPFTTPDGQTIKGVKVVESNQIGVGYVLVGDMSKVRVFIYKPFTISMGWVSDDFERNLVTIIGETRIHFYIEDAYTTALVYDALSDIKTAILLT
jgi:HK97 family phage major capsid protein